MSAALWIVRVLDIGAMVAVAVMLGLAWSHRGRTERCFLVPMLIGVEAWILGDLIAKSPVGAGVVRGAVVLQLVVSGVVVLSLVLFVLAYTGREDVIRPPLVASLSVEPVAFALLALTDPRHGLVFRESIGPNAVVDAAGPALLGHVVYSYALVVVALGLAGRLLYRAEVVYRRQATALVLGILAPFLGNVLYFFGPSPVDLTPVMFGLTGGLLTYAALRANLLEFSPVARSVVLDTISSGVLVLDRHGTVLDSNPQAGRLLGVDGRVPVGRPVTDLLSDRNPALERLADAVPPDAEREFELDVGDRVLDGRIVPLLGLGDRSVGAAVVLHDVTDRERRRRELRRQRERLDRFASVVSHDLRNPLNIAAGGVALAREEGDLEHLHRVVDAHERMETIVEETLTLARQGESLGDEDDVDLARLCEDAWGMVESEDATMEVEAATIRGDRNRLRDLFENLFRNAVEHGSTSPRSRAREDSVEHGSTSSRAQSDDAVEHAGRDVAVRVELLPDGFLVEDDGPGIPASKRSQVVELGYSVADGGTGLGLAIVEEVADAHGWEFTVTDGRDGGARFEFTGVTFVER
ncbi:MAG: histidine kinase N-terminal 7TM domain-containing protein [Haloarculaceae archaeon]